MGTRARLALIPLLLALMGAAAGAGEPRLVHDPAAPGPNQPPAGASMFDELYRGPDGRHILPFPFADLLLDLERRIAPATATTVLVPLGRSLQRHAAWPDYFAAPRVLAAVTDDPGAAGRPFLKDRLYLGYHARAEVIEVISWNEAAGRFEFQVVEDYAAGRTPRVEAGERTVCVSCHQSQSPIFPTALWNETNANPKVAARLTPLGERYHGVPVRGSVDRSDALDRSTDRAFRFAFTDWLWRQGCGDGARGAACRAMLLYEALAFRLRGDRPSERTAPGAGALPAALADRAASLAPHGIAAPSPDLPDRDPLEAIEGGGDAFAVVEPAGPFEPTASRPPVRFDLPADPADLLRMAARDVAGAFADRDVVALDRWLGAAVGPGADARFELACRVDRRADSGGDEIRFDCSTAGDAGRLALRGFASVRDGRVTGGRVRTLSLAEAGGASRLTITGGGLGTGELVLELAEATLGLAPRTTADLRILPLRLRFGADPGAAALDLALVDDLGPLRGGLRRMETIAASEPAAALGSGPLRRRAVLAELAAGLQAR